MFLPLRRARWPLHTKMGRICKVAVEMTRRINRGESQTGYSPALGNPHQTRVPTFPQRRRRRGAWQRRGQTPLKSGSLPDSCTEPEKLSLRIVGFCFIALAVYITYEALADLLRKTAPEHSIPGIALACVSLIVMPILSSTKKRVGSALNSAAMKADTWQTDFSIYPESSACKQSLSRNFDCFLSMRAAPCAASCPPPITGGKQCGNAHQQRLTNAQATE